MFVLTRANFKTTSGNIKNIVVNSMQNRPPTILSPQNVSQLKSKFKFWDTSLAGHQRSPKNMSLVTSSDVSNDNSQTSQYPRIVTNSQTSNNVADDDSVINSDSSEVDEKSQEPINEVDKIKLLQQQVQVLRAEIEEGRVLNANLLKQLNKTNNQLRVAQKLNDELRAQCQKFYVGLKLAHDKQSQVQNQKMQLLIQISSLNQQKQIAVNKSQIIEQQMYYLHKKIESLHEQISFQKSISADLKKETLILKEQLNQTLSHLKDYSALQEQVAKTHIINDQIKKRFINLQEQLTETRRRVQQSQKSQQISCQQQNKLFLKIKELQNQNIILSQKLAFTSADFRYHVENHESTQQMQGQYQGRYVKILQQLQRRNHDLIFQLMAVNQRNHKLVDQRDFYMRRVQASNSNRKQRLPYDQFVCILKATQDQIQTIKRKMQLKQDQYQRLRNQHQAQSFNTQARIRQLNSILQIKERQMTTRQHLMQNQKNIYKKQYDLMMKRNQELKNSQVKLRLQANQKDRIIMEFIQKQKILQEKERSQYLRSG